MHGPRITSFRRRQGAVLTVSVLALAMLACSASSPAASGSQADSGLSRGTLTIQAATGPLALDVEIAETPEDRQRGLMHRQFLDREAGMVFLFGSPRDGGFWMKNTLIPLSIAFWDEDRRVVAILQMEPCREDPCPVYSPEATYVGAVEVNQGVLEEHGVRVGDPVELDRGER